jgi:hypothetical protein
MAVLSFLADIVDANTERDKKKRQQRGEPELYADQQRARGITRPVQNIGQQLVGNTLRFLNTVKAGGGGALGLGETFAASIGGNNQAYERAKQGTAETLKKDLSPTGGLLGAGTLFENPGQAQNIGASDLAKKTVGGGFGVASEVLPIPFGKAAEGASLATRAVRGAAAGATGAGLSSAAEQLVLKGSIDPRELAKSTAFGAAVGGTVPVAGSVIRNRIPLNEGGFVKIPDDIMSRLSKATDETEVRKVLKDLPDDVSARVAPAIAQTKDPNIIQNIINRANEPKISDIGGARPFNDIQKNIEAAHNAGDNVTASKLIDQLPVENQGAMRSALNIPPPQEVPAAQRVISALDEASKQRGTQEQLYSAERSKRFAAAKSAGAKLPGTEGYKAELRQLKGELPKVDYRGLAETVAPDEQEKLFSELRSQVQGLGLQTGQSISTQTALRKVIFGEGGVPTRSEIQYLRNAFGDDFAEKVVDSISGFEKAKNLAYEVAGVPRALMATADVSFGLRQGLAAGTRHPVLFAKNFVKQFKYLKSDDAFKELTQEITSHPNYDLMKKARLAITDIAGDSATNREEQYVSTLAEKIPGLGRIVRASDRAYTGFATSMRANIFNGLIDEADRAGIPLSDKLLRNLGEVVNTGTGRGSLGKLEASAQNLSTALFAPRLIASRLQMFNPQYYIKLDPLARKEALTTLLSLGTVVGSVAGMAKLAGADVEADPRSSDFAKIKVGDTRFDIAGGFQQYVRLGAQLASGKIISSTTGSEMTLGGDGYRPLTRADILARFAQGKESPVVSFVTDLLKGEDFAGQPIDVKDAVVSRFIPLVAQDLADIYGQRRYQGESVGKSATTAVGVAPLTATGVGTQTYGTFNRGVSDNQRAYLKFLDKQGASKEELSANERFFKELGQASGKRTTVSKKINDAIAEDDPAKATQLAEEYNKMLAEGMTRWVKKYGEEYGSSTLQEAYNKRKLSTSPQSFNSRQKSVKRAELLGTR